MADELYTTNHKAVESTKLSNDINATVSELQDGFQEQPIEALHWNENYVVIPLVISVDLPSRGPVGNIDIRKKEPIFLMLSKHFYPHIAPTAWSNRKDFPAAQLPHLNPRPKGSPPNFCLHRGNINNWFAEHTIIDFIQRVRSWLRDAARNRLIRQEDGFEFTRISDSFGYSIYELKTITDIVYSSWRHDNGMQGSLILWYSLLQNPDKDPLIGKDTYAIRLECQFSPEQIAKPLEISNKINKFHSKENKLERMLFGVLAWPKKKQICRNYFTEIPDKLGDFIQWAEDFGIPLENALKTYLSKGLQLLNGVPVTIIIPRPQRIIGTRSSLEPLNFIILTSGEHMPQNGRWNLNTKVISMGHRVPLTRRRASDISSQSEYEDFGRLLFLGCGAVGSKFILHLAKSGQINMTLVDYDELSPHNLVRHGLLSESTGRNKADAIKDAIQGIFYTDKSVKIDTIKDSALNLFVRQNEMNKKLLEKHTWLIDTTASSMMLNVLAQANLPKSLGYFRCEIAYNGRLGFLLAEGINRNPRIDDLQILLFDSANENYVVSQWLQEHKEEREQVLGSGYEEISVGISCSSETMRLSDELVSLHATSFASGFRRCVTEGNQNRTGRIQISQYREQSNITSIVQHIDVSAITIISARNDPTWQVRLKHGLLEKMRELLYLAMPDETGGLLIGLVNFKRKIIYVTRILPAPPDSKGSPYAFERGIQDIPNTIFDIQKRSGSMLGYVGEWHTHPTGGPELSLVDRIAIDKIKKKLDYIPLPTHIIIITPRGIYSHIFSPK